MSTAMSACTTSSTGACRSYSSTSASPPRVESPASSWKRWWARGPAEAPGRHLMDTIMTAKESMRWVGSPIPPRWRQQGASRLRIRRLWRLWRQRCVADRVGLRGAPQGRLGVQAAQEHFERQRRGLEVAAQELEVGSGLLEAGDRQLRRAQRFPDVALQRRLQGP